MHYKKKQVPDIDEMLMCVSYFDWTVNMFLPIMYKKILNNHTASNFVICLKKK